ncbi:MAG: efflux RND transporter permease subunit [Methylobacter sp.]|nr:efflux RND transporter permease subunit [Methylobacter sp.]MDP2428136.1 efflux RND transporter permease subunit [Methylobacter sp.]MDP3054396.1 efflux RND transporter permease subunit [Methylobacter sp.]MDP3364314.1 efflux RND transporter permease subunit [Methylobacter sp.]MDZ4220010.1 efflux RND transporter permease subunit [Methylobacter sp.]
MLPTLVRFSIRFYGIVIALALLILLYGSYRFATAGLDIFPEFSPKQVIIQTEAPGLASEQVEVLVTQPTETAISGLIGMKSVRSESIQGLSIITAIFAEDSDVYRNRQLVSERLTTLSTQLPPGITPVVIPLSSSSATVLTIGLSKDGDADLMALRSLVDWTIVPRLKAVPGVADVNVFGGDIQQLQIQVGPVQLQRFNLTLEDIIQAATQAGHSQGGGFIENDNQRFTLQITGQPATPEQFAKILVKREQGRSVTLGEVATISYAPEPPIGAAQIMGKPGIVLMVIGQYDANTLSVSRLVEQALQEFEPIFSKQAINFYPHLFRPADYIERSLSNLSGHLLIGGLFVLIILYLFLFNFRTAFISALAIPVSLVGAVIVLLESGVNLNIMVLGGLAIALGEVVDDAIIDTENIFRRLRENRLLPKPLPVAEVVYSASLEVRSSVVYASFIVALVFVPLLTLDGVAGRLFAPLGYSYILAILTSLLVALTLTPALCYALLGNANLVNDDPPLIRRIKPLYKALLGKVFTFFKPVMVGSALVCLSGLLAFFTLDSKFLPELREGHYIIHTTSIPGTALQESIRIGSKLTEQFMAIPGIQSVSQWAGRAERGADTYGSHYSEYDVRLEPMSGAEQQQIKDKLRAILVGFPGIVFEANTFLTERVDETISGYTSPVAVNIYGNDLNKLDAKAQAVAEVMRDIAGAADVQLRSPPGTPLLQIVLDLDRLSFWGVMPAQIVATLQAAYETRVVGKNIQGNKIYNVAVTLTPELRAQPESIAKLPVRTLDGTLVTLGQVADIRHSASRYNILHQGSQRRQTVTGNVQGRDLDDFVSELKARVLQDIPFPADSYPEFTGAAVEQAQARQELILHSLLAGAGVLVFVYIAIGSIRHVLLTLANLPFALIGGVAAVMLTGATLSVGSVVGFVTLFGITVRNSIMLLSHYRYLVEDEGKPWNLDTAIQGAQERLPSILMTALVTALAMFPIAFNSDNPGREIMGPMAAIIIGGLASSTVLNLLLLPALLLRYGKFNRQPEL